MKNIISNKNNLQVLFEDNHIIAINKRCGDIVQGDKTGDKPLSEIVKSFLKTKYSKPGNVYLGIPHRLDRPTSGVVMFAKTSKSLSRLNKIFKDGKVQKYYWAVTKNNPEKQEDTLIHWLRKNEKTNKSTYFKKETVKAKKAVLHYSVLKKLEKYFIIDKNNKIREVYKKASKENFKIINSYKSLKKLQFIEFPKFVFDELER